MTCASSIWASVATAPPEYCSRVKSVPNGTRLVLFEYARGNEARHHITDSAANMAAIKSELAARNIKSIDITDIISLRLLVLAAMAA